MAFNRAVATTPAWTVIVPIRSLTEGKTRMGGYPSAPSLAGAFCTDVITACRQCPEIEETYVVSADPAVLDVATSLGARTFREDQARGINAAIASVRSELPPGAAVIAILGDTPCLDADVLSTVADAAREFPTSFVPDAAGTGTTMWCSTDQEAQPHFGEHSRAHHRRAGAIELGAADNSVTWAKARRDVDTEIDLWDAQRLGVGPATSQVTG